MSVRTDDVQTSNTEAYADCYRAHHVPQNKKQETGINARFRSLPNWKNDYEKTSGNLFNVDYVSLCKLLKMVMPSIPPKQAKHVLRLTFASHFMINEGNIIALQRIQGNAHIQQTKTSTYLSPEYQQNAIALNQLA